MFALFLAVLVWIVLSVVATPVIGRFLVMREAPEDRETYDQGLPVAGAAAIVANVPSGGNRARQFPASGR